VTSQRQVRRRDLERLFALLLVTCVAVGLTMHLAVNHRNFDIRVYVGAVTSWADGGDLYAYGIGNRHLGFTYPPFAALLMVPMTLVPRVVVIVANASLIAVAAAVVTRMCVCGSRLAARYGALLTTAFALPVAMLLQPLRDTLGFGQVNLFLAVLVLADLVALRRGSRWAGVGAGLATAIKLTPGLFVVFLLLVGERRAARNGVLAAAAATLATAVVVPGTSWTYWTSALFDSSRIGHHDDAANQSIGGVLARLSDSQHLPTGPWLLAVAIVLPLGLSRARRAWRRGDDLAAYALVGLTAGLVSPITWVHHLIWLVPALVVIVDTGLAGVKAQDITVRRRAAALLLLAAATVALFASGVNLNVGQHVGHHLTRGLGVILGENAYGVWTLLLLLTVPTDRRSGVRTAHPKPPRERVTVDQPTKGQVREREQPAPR